jgi:hypothetical protein
VRIYKGYARDFGTKYDSGMNIEKNYLNFLLKMSVSAL